MTLRSHFIGKVDTVSDNRVVRDVFDTGADLELRDGGVVEDDAWVEVEVDDAGQAHLSGPVLARGGSARALLWEILADLRLDPVFPEAVLREARDCQKRPGFDDPALRDLRELAFVTIDNDDSMDLDQALYLARADAESGAAYDVWYALADASHCVAPGTALFAEALRRGATYYLPRLNVPMLPRVLSEDLISLGPNVHRSALVFHIRLGPAGEVVEGGEVTRALIESRAKLTYDGVQAFHDAPTGSPLSGRSYTESLELMRTVGELRIAAAIARDVVFFHRKSVVVDFADAGGLTFDTHGGQRNDVERWNEQISLLCNIEGAALFARSVDNRHVQPIYRVHDSPHRDALDSLAVRIDALRAVHGLDASWRWRRDGAQRESLADYVARLPREPEVQRISTVIERLAMMSGTASVFSAEMAPHYGVGAAGYSRFSAPMREIVGIFTHKEALDAMTDPNGEFDDAADIELRAKVIEAANRAKETQRRVTKRSNKLAIDQLLAEDLAHDRAERPVRRGTVLGVRASRLYVQLDEPPIEVKLYTAHLEEALGISLTTDTEDVVLSVEPGLDGPKFRMGSAIDIVVAGYDDDHDKWILLPA